MKKQKSEHKMGKSTGYDVSPDGKYSLSPTYISQFDRLTDEANGLEDLIQSVNSFASKRFAQLQEEKRALWNRILDDLGIVEKEGWVYRDGTIWRKDKKDEPKL